ncbi:unnamed protein product [Albugo candida]|uniref:Uncharacterized protein n=1 Tax=Albugo candida TaxID=65357 RepID=A0A024GHK1_9STRA|nr:unnamed protein product [Albugo candida]|eukprot:CCI46185.1 unnamed protein product [Albugo candida]
MSNFRQREGKRKTSMKRVLVAGVLVMNFRVSIKSRRLPTSEHAFMASTIHLRFGWMTQTSEILLIFLFLQTPKNKVLFSLNIKIIRNKIQHTKTSFIVI